MPLNQADLDAIGERVAAAVAATQPRKTIRSWTEDNAATVLTALALVASAFAFNDRVGHLEQRMDALIGHVDDDFRALTGKIDNLAIQVGHDEGATAKKP